MSAGDFWTTEEWSEWSNDLARLIPEGDESRYANPDGAQESIIEACLRAYVRDRSEPYEPPWLRELVEEVTYKPGWLTYLRTEFDDDGAGGLTLFIVSSTEDSYTPGQTVRVRHAFLVPRGSYNRDTWAAWLFDRFRDVETHEAGEFFMIDGYREFAPHHGNGEDPYRVWHVGDHAAARKKAGDT